MPYREQSAVALNNMGVHLLERGCYRQAAVTLQDAGMVIRSYRPQLRQVTMVEIERKIEAANQRLVSEISNPRRIGLGFLSSGSQIRDTDFKNPRTTRSLFGYALRIDSRSEFSIEHLSSIVMQNAGVAMLCQSQVSGNVAAAARLRRFAVTLFRSALQFLPPNGISEGPESVSPKNLRTVFLSVCVLSGYARALTDAGCVPEATEMMLRIARLRMLALDVEEELSGNGIGAEVGAPAA